jgi:quinol monooxygenase YgiN
MTQEEADPECLFFPLPQRLKQRLGVNGNNSKSGQHRPPGIHRGVLPEQLIVEYCLNKDHRPRNGGPRTPKADPRTAELQQFLTMKDTHSNLGGAAMAALASRNAVIVVVDIKEDRIEDFLKVMEMDAKGSRDQSQDPGCMRFDFLHSRDIPNRYYFYEVFTDDEGAAQHRTTAHYKAWADFKASGGVEKQEVLKLETASIPGGWALQANNEPHSQAGACMFVQVQIKPDRIDDFFKAIEVNGKGSRIRGLDPGCLRFDLLRSKDDEHKFVFYEAFTDDEAIAYHKTTDHFKKWSDFRATDGVAKQIVWKAEASSIPGTWAFQGASVKAGEGLMPLVFGERSL